MALRELSPVERSIARLKKIRDEINMEIAALAATLPQNTPGPGKRQMMFIDPLASTKKQKR